MQKQQASAFLGVSPNASEDEIKKAYKTLAKKYHPDRPTGSTEKFQTLQKAYDTMTKPEEQPGFNPFQGHPAANIFETMFRAHATQQAHTASWGGASQGARIFTQVTHTFPLRAILQGTVNYKGVQLPHWIRDGDNVKVNQQERLRVQIQWPRGVSSHSSGRNNILLRKSISLDIALLGRETQIIHPDGRPLRLKARDYVFQNNRQYKIRGEGLPDRNGDRGDMYVEFYIKMPEQLSDTQKERLKQIFPEKPPVRVHHETIVECEV